VPIVGAWLVLGAGWVFNGLSGMATLGSALDDGAFSSAPPDALSFLEWTRIALVTEVLVGVVAIALAAGLLRARPWGRAGLESMSVLLLVALGAFVVRFVVVAAVAGNAVMLLGSVLGMVLGWPIWIMRRHLRGEPMRRATKVRG
jgi:hypothetical protein